MKDLELLNIKKLIDDVEKESISQITKWGVQDHEIPEWLMIINEEVGELNKAGLEHWFGKNSMRFSVREQGLYKASKQIYEEAIQVATLALKIAEMNMKD